MGASLNRELTLQSHYGMETFKKCSQNLRVKAVPIDCPWTTWACGCFHLPLYVCRHQISPAVCPVAVIPCAPGYSLDSMFLASCSHMSSDSQDEVYVWKGEKESRGRETERVKELYQRLGCMEVYPAPWSDTVEMPAQSDSMLASG